VGNPSSYNFVVSMFSVAFGFIFVSPLIAYARSSNLFRLGKLSCWLFKKTKLETL
jgi:hypothetical protein